MRPTDKGPIRYSHLGDVASDPVISRLMAAALDNPELLSLAAGFTDNAVLPEALIAETVAELSARDNRAEHLQYGTTQGRPLLRQLVCRHLMEKQGERPDGQDSNSRLSPDSTVICSGSQQALYIAMQVLCDPDDIVLVEQPSYFVFLELLNGLGIEARSMPVTEDHRLDIPALDEMISRMKEKGEYNRLKAIYIVTYFQNPSSRCVPEADKRALGKLLNALDRPVPVIEDAAYRELYFDQPYPARSVLSLPEFGSLPCLYCGTFTKPLSTGLKTGYCVSTEPELLRKMLCVKGHHDFGSANLNQAITETLLGNGQYGSFLDKVRPHYKRKMEILENALRSEGLDELGWRWDAPEGGLLHWVEAPETLDTGIDSPFCKACIDAGVLYVPGELCFAPPAPRNFIRLSFGTLPPDRLEEGAKRFVKAARAFA